MSKKVTPCLWFDKQAEEAARFYCGIFPRSEVTEIMRAPTDYPNGKAGDVLLVEFTLTGRPFTALNGGPNFRFTEAISLQVSCADQAELDRYMDALSVEPDAEVCGWIKDKYGLSWQLFPIAMAELLRSADAPARARAFTAMMGMKRLDIAALEAAAAG